MNSSAQPQPSRRRGARERIGADAARVWARELHLGNPYAKSVLLAVANYMNEDGAAWPGLATIASDTDIGEETVAKRLRWLESIGAIALFKCWRDENGRRNFDGRGKPTASEIRFLFDADIDAIEDAAKDSEDRPLRGAARRAHERCAVADSGEGDDDPAAESSIRPRRGLDSDQHPVSTPVAPDQPPPGAGRHIDSLEQEQERFPPPPLSGGVQATVDEELESDISEFASHYPAPITNLPRLRLVLGAISREQRRRVIVGAKGYSAYIADLVKSGKKRSVKDADRWVAAGMWQGYVMAGEKAEAAALAANVPKDSAVGRALVILHRIAHMTAPIESAGMYRLQRPLSAQALALAKVPNEADWVFIPHDQENQCGAWNELLARELRGKPRPELIWDRNRNGARGFMAPWPWPPRKDGTLSTTGPPPCVSLSDQDIQDFK